MLTSCLAGFVALYDLTATSHARVDPGDGGLSTPEITKDISEEQIGKTLRENPSEERINEFSLAGQKLHIDVTKEQPRLMDDSDDTLYYFGKSEVVRESIASESEACLLLRVMIQRPQAKGAHGVSYDYGYILRIVVESDGKTRVSRVMDSALPPMNMLHRTVSELGAVSDDGKIALLKFGEADREETPYKMTYSWQTWDLDTPKALGTGLRLGDDVKQP